MGGNFSRIGVRALGLSIFVALGAATSLPAHGQWPESAYSFGSGTLSAEDIELIKRSAAPLFQADRSGATTTWRNPKSGNEGSIRLVRIYELKGMPCRLFQYSTKFRDRSAPSVRRVDWCRFPDGEWKQVDPVELRGG